MVKLIALSALLLAGSNLVSCSAIPDTEDNVARALPPLPKMKLDTRSSVPHCDPHNNTVKLYAAEVKTCIDYLLGLRGSTFTAIQNDDDSQLICSQTTVHVTVRAEPVASTTSLVTDIAAGVQWVYDNCKVPGHEELRNWGVAPANGNGNLLVKTGLS